MHVLKLDGTARSAQAGSNDPDAAIAALQTTASKTGTAHLCLDDAYRHLDRDTQIDIPATTIFKDDGPNGKDQVGAKKDDPSTWYVNPSESVQASFITMATIRLSPTKPCADVPVKRYVGVLTSKDLAQKAGDNRIYTIESVADYPIPAHRPKIEMGKVLDDLAVLGVLFTDVDDAYHEADHDDDMEKNAKECMDQAQAMAAFMGQGVERQTDTNVFLGQLDGGDVTFGCSKWSASQPDIFVAWNGAGLPPGKVLRFIAKAGAYLTGATQDEIRTETLGCTRDALKPDAGEIGQRQVRGVQIDCQAFDRDGGGGSATISRRLGSYPKHAQLNAASRASLEEASAQLREKEERKQAGAMAFARWWMDGSIPKEAKTFAMMAARAIALNERCPSDKIPPARIVGWAIQLNQEASDFTPGGKYAALMAMMLSSFSSEGQKESQQEACEQITKYNK